MSTKGFKSSQLWMLEINGTPDLDRDIYTSRKDAEEGKVLLLQEWEKIVGENAARGITTATYPVEIITLEQAISQEIGNRIDSAHREEQDRTMMGSW